MRLECSIFFILCFKTIFFHRAKASIIVKVLATLKYQYHRFRTKRIVRKNHFLHEFLKISLTPINEILLLDHSVRPDYTDYEKMST